MIPKDFTRTGDFAKELTPVELVGKTTKQIEQATTKLETTGAGCQPLAQSAEKICALAEGPLAPDDWMLMRAERLSPETKSALARQGLTAENVLADPDKAESYVGEVLKREGIPDGNGSTDPVKDITSGHHEGVHGFDLIAADHQGVPVPIEVKKYDQPSAAQMEDRGVTDLEPEVEKWRKERQAQVSAYRHGRLTDVRADAKATWKPEVQEWRSELRQDARRMTRDESGRPELPVQQMDDLWTRDRWLKLIKTPAGRDRMQGIGVDKRYLDYDRLRNSPDLPEWRNILDRRTVVIVSDRNGSTGRRMFDQAVFEKRARRVMKIEV